MNPRPADYEPAALPLSYTGYVHARGPGPGMGLTRRPVAVGGRSSAELRERKTMTPGGFEPAIAAMRTQHPEPLDDGAEPKTNELLEGVLR